MKIVRRTPTTSGHDHEMPGRSFVFASLPAPARGLRTVPLSGVCRALALWTVVAGCTTTDDPFAPGKSGLDLPDAGDSTPMAGQPGDSGANAMTSGGGTGSDGSAPLGQSSPDAGPPGPDEPDAATSASNSDDADSGGEDVAQASPKALEGGAADAYAGGGLTPCSQANYLICEDFEDTAVGSVPQGWQRGCLYGGTNCVPAASVAVASDEAYESAHSLKLGVNGTGAQNYRTMTRSGAVLGAAHWGRIYYKVDVPVLAYFSHDTLVHLQGMGPTSGSEDLRVIDTVQNADHTHQFLYNVQPSGAEFGKGSSYTYNFADDKWHCAEYSIDNASQSYHFYIDGSEVTQIAVTNGAGQYAGSQIPAAFSTIGVGVNQYQSPPSGQATPLWMTVWIDNVAFDSKRIGCK